MSKQMIRLAKKIFYLMGKYIVAYRKEYGDPYHSVFIKDDRTGEVIVYGASWNDVIETAKIQIKIKHHNSTDNVEINPHKTKE